MVSNPVRKECVGIVGGVGPRASAGFLKTIYECSLGGREQDAPVVLMCSDPTFPDRAEALVAGDDERLTRQLSGRLRSLRRMGATRTVICCVTMHHLPPRLPKELIYQVKKNRDVRELVPTLESLLTKYGVSSFISGWTEMHLLSKHLSASNGGRSSVDPLTLVARRNASGSL